MSKKKESKNQFYWAPRHTVGTDKTFLIRRIDLGYGEVGLVYEVIGKYWHPQPMQNVNLPRFAPGREGHGIDWDAQPLGKVPDSKLAKELEVSRSTVTKVRQQRGIAPSDVSRSVPRSRPKINWDEQPLGKEYDSAIARRLGVSSRTVTKARNARNIPRCCINWDAQPLGEEPDSVLAEKLGVDRSSVASARRTRGITAKQPRKNIDWNKEPLGKISDSDIARALGVSQPRVTKARNALGIPPFNAGSVDDKEKKQRKQEDRPSKKRVFARGAARGAGRKNSGSREEATRDGH